MSFLFKMGYKRITWMWIEIKSNEDLGALALILLAKEIGDKPHRMSGIPKIREWLEGLGVLPSYRQILSELQTMFHNEKSMAFKSPLLDPGCDKWG